MTDINTICYKKSFLKQVIVRTDFLQFLETANILYPKIEEEILKVFPRRGKNQIIRFNEINVDVNTGESGIPNARGSSREGIQKEYFTIDGKNKIILSNKFLIFDINNYQSYVIHKKWFQSIILTFCEINRPTVVRTGIRFINIFDSSQIKLQKKYFSNEIAASLVIKPNQETSGPCLVRSMHTNEYRCDLMSLNFRYGMFNPEYPSILKTNSFVLDYDCFTEEPIDTPDGILRSIDNGHDFIQKMFENSITDSLRKVMKDE